MSEKKEIKPGEIISYAAKVAAFMTIVGMIFAKIGDVSGLITRSKG